jgi:hypothetical protein
MADYYLANDTKALIGTFDGGYYYPETHSDLLKKPDQMKTHARSRSKSFTRPPLSNRGHKSWRVMAQRTANQSTPPLQMASPAATALPPPM